MTSKLPLVSVVIPVYNANGYLPQALDSILAQTYPKIEIIAVDDHSTDNSWQTLQTYARRHPHLKCFRNTRNRHIAYTLNRGVKLAKGQYIARMDADDVSLPHRVADQVHFLLHHPRTVIVGGQCLTIDTQNQLIGKKTFPTKHQQIRNQLYLVNPLQHPAIMINRRLLPKNFTWYQEHLPPTEDLDLFFHLGQYGRYANLPSFVLKYRQYPYSQTFKNPKHTFHLAQQVRYMAMIHYGYQPTLLAKILSPLQNIIIKLLPDKLIFPLYTLLRGSHSLISILRPAKLILWPKTSPKLSTASP